MKMVYWGDDKIIWKSGDVYFEQKLEGNNHSAMSKTKAWAIVIGLFTALLLFCIFC